MAAATGTTHDVVVVGGGVIGLAVAWRLLGRGRSVAVVDPAPASAASRAAAGMLAPVTEVQYGEEPLLALALESLRRYPGFVEELEHQTGMTVGLRRDGTLVVGTDAGDRAALEQLHDFQRSLNLDATLLTARECRHLEPGLSPEVRCGLLAASDHSVDNRRLTRALLQAVRAARGDLVIDHVTEVLLDDLAVRGVGLAGGDSLIANTVVIAAGPWSAQLGGIPADARPPVRPVKGEILRLRADGRHPLPTRSLRALVGGHSVYLVPRADGELVVGATAEERGFDTTVRAGAVRELLRDARAVYPGVDELELVETLAALRPGSPDNRPIIGKTAVAGLVLATGHYRNGVLLAPVTADVVADLVTGRDTDEALLSIASPARLAEAPA